MASLKDQKQQFVSDLLGGTLREIYYVVGVSVAGYVAFKSLSTSEYVGYSLVIDFLLNVVVLLASITAYSNNIATLYQSLLVPVFVVVLVKVVSQLNSKTTKSKTQRQNQTGEILQQKGFITAYRSHMLIMTNLAILAVDFHIFPRRFAKVETWGTSIMDMGVGSFVFSMGLVNSRSIIKQKIEGNDSKFGLAKYFSLIFTNFKKSLPMLVFGIIRFISVKGLEYQEHVTEYGIHWNFFFTLGLLPTFLAILNPLFDLIPRSLVACLIAGSYELVLTKTGLLKFILSNNNRLDNIVTMNKEGIFSFFGYLSIFIFGQSFGSFVLTSVKTPNNLIGFKKHGKSKSWLTVSTTKGLIISTVVFQALSIFVKESPLFYNISRRLANLPYVLMTVSYNSLFLLAYQLAEFSGSGSSNTTGSKILESINRNGLIIFLLGNLFTGLTNMTINTLECDSKLSFMILLGYGASFTTIALVLDKLGIYIKI